MVSPCLVFCDARVDTGKLILGRRWLYGASLAYICLGPNGRPSREIPNSSCAAINNCPFIRPTPIQITYPDIQNILSSWWQDWQSRALNWYRNVKCQNSMSNLDYVNQYFYSFWKSGSVYMYWYSRERQSFLELCSPPWMCRNTWDWGQ